MLVWVLAAFAAGVSTAQSTDAPVDDTTVVLELGGVVGQTYRYDSEAVKSLDGQAVGPPIRYEETFEVLESEPGELVFRCSRKAPDARRQSPEMADLLERDTPEFILDEHGEFAGLRNWEESRDAKIAFAEWMIESRRKNDPMFTDADAAESIEITRTKLQKRDLIEGQSWLAVAHLLAPAQLTLSKGDPLEIKGDTTAAFAGIRVPTIERMWIEKIDGDLITYVWEQTIDRERGAEQLQMVLEHLNQSMRVRDDLPAEQRFNGTSRKTTVFDRSLGWPREVEFATTLTINGQEQMQVERWKLIEPQ